MLPWVLLPHTGRCVPHQRDSSVPKVLCCQPTAANPCPTWTLGLRLSWNNTGGSLQTGCPLLWVLILVFPLTLPVPVISLGEAYTKEIFGLLFLPWHFCAPWWLCRKLLSHNRSSSFTYIYTLTILKKFSSLEVDFWMSPCLQKNKMNFWYLVLKSKEKLNRKLEWEWCEAVLM